MKSDMDLELFYEWIAAECYLSPRVSGSVRQLWDAYAAYANRQKLLPERFAFVQAMSTAFLVRSGMAGGICLERERASYFDTPSVGVPHRAFRSKPIWTHRRPSRPHVREIPGETPQAAA